MKKILFALMTVVILGSCSDTTSTLPASSGRTAEMLVIMDKFYWESDAGKQVQTYFADYQPFLNQAEPWFDLQNLPPKSFSDMFKTHRNILMIEIDESIGENKSEARRDVWASNQVVVKIQANSPEEFAKLFEGEKDQYFDLFYDVERKRSISAFKRTLNYTLVDSLKRNFGFDLVVPENYKIAKCSKSFCWLRRLSTEMDLGIIITKEPYTDTLAFENKKILADRDSLTKAFVPARNEGSYMTVEYMFQPQTKEVTFNGLYAVETRGFWTAVGDVMGGPFVNYRFVDKEGKYLITIDGFVFAPKFKKRDLLRQLESIIYSYKVAE